MAAPRTGKTTGRPPKSIEQKRLTGNPGKRSLPDQATVTLLPGAAGPPEPARPLGAAGAALWERIWKAGATWLAATVDAEQILLLCERMDERAGLRFRVLSNNDWRERAGLRALEAQIDGTLSSLGFTPVDRARLNVAEVKPASRIEALLARRNGTAQ